MHLYTDVTMSIIPTSFSLRYEVRRSHFEHYYSATTLNNEAKMNYLNKHIKATLRCHEKKSSMCISLHKFKATRPLVPGGGRIRVERNFYLVVYYH